MAPISPILPRGTGIGLQNFTQDSEKCRRYALFMHDMGDRATNGTIWACFLFIIILLITSSHFFAQSEEKRQAFLRSESENVAGNARLEREYQTHAWRCTWVTIVILPLMFMALFIFAITALNLQFCHGEDLMMFYWASWTLIGCGSFIAEVGLVIAQLQNCLHPHHPTAPWGVALGTPVPVICGAAHYIRNFFKYGHTNDQEIETSHNTASQTSFSKRGRPFSTATTEKELVQIYRAEGPLPEGAEILGILADDQGLLVVKTPRVAVYAVSASGTSRSREMAVAERPSRDVRNSSS